MGANGGHWCFVGHPCTHACMHARLPHLRVGLSARRDFVYSLIYFTTKLQLVVAVRTQSMYVIDWVLLLLLRLPRRGLALGRGERRVRDSTRDPPSASEGVNSRTTSPTNQPTNQQTDRQTDRQTSHLSVYLSGRPSGSRSDTGRRE
eukprot:GHVU01056179.1.p1 GENE.GHVU01056179.1~~GHVU01056179.1.p1  ORF type:complete len:147 (-),score=8.52 GHVU01056179.1:387-827(-)